MIRKILILPLVFLVLLAGCVAETASEKGAIQFTSSPSGAQIYLDSQFRGTTPSSLTGIEPGNHTLEFRYAEYQSWSTVMLVSHGQNNVFVALIPLESTASPASLTTPAPASAAPVSISLQLDRETMIIGDSLEFSGRAAGCDAVILTLYGPGSYADGIVISKPDVNSLGTWNFMWNPGSKLLRGTYTIKVTDPNNTISEMKKFSVVGGGMLGVSTSTSSAGRGETIQISGICSTGSPKVRLVLTGPDRYASGVELGIFSVQANNNFYLEYTLDSTMPNGLYTIYASDVPITTSATTQFTVGYVGQPLSNG